MIDGSWTRWFRAASPERWGLGLPCPLLKWAALCCLAEDCHGATWALGLSVILFSRETRKPKSYMETPDFYIMAADSTFYAVFFSSIDSPRFNSYITISASFVPSPEQTSQRQSEV